MTEDHDKSLLAVLGNSVRNLRERRGLSQERLAELAGVDRSFISRIERGMANPSFLTMIQISRSLDSGLADLLQGLNGNEQQH